MGLDLDLVLVLFRKFRYDSLIYIILGSPLYEGPPHMYEYPRRKKIRTVFIHSVQLSAPPPRRLIKGMTRSARSMGSARLAGLVFIRCCLFIITCGCKQPVAAGVGGLFLEVFEEAEVFCYE